MARCPKCNADYIFDFPTVGKTVVDWELLKRAFVHFVTTCPRCKGVFRAGTEDYLSWKEQQYFGKDEGLLPRKNDSSPSQVSIDYR